MQEFLVHSIWLSERDSLYLTLVGACFIPFSRWRWHSERRSLSRHVYSVALIQDSYAWNSGWDSSRPFFSPNFTIHAGISVETQILRLVVFVARYLDLLNGDRTVPVHNTVMKITIIGTSLHVVTSLVFRHKCIFSYCCVSLTLSCSVGGINSLTSKMG